MITSSVPCSIHGKKRYVTDAMKMEISRTRSSPRRETMRGMTMRTRKDAPAKLASTNPMAVAESPIL